MDTVLNWLWQGTVVAAAAFVMLLALQRARANVRYVVCWAVLLLVLALPAFPSVQMSAGSTGAFRAQQDAMVSLPDAWWTSTLVLLAAWLVWVMAHLVRFVSAIAAIRQARIRSGPFPPSEESNLSHWV